MLSSRQVTRASAPAPLRTMEVVKAFARRSIFFRMPAIRSENNLRSIVLRLRRENGAPITMTSPLSLNRADAGNSGRSSNDADLILVTL